MSETKLLTKEERCEGRVIDSNGRHSHQCTKRHQPNSRFCKTHDPEIRKARYTKWWEAERDAKEKAEKQAEAARKLTEHKAACFDELLAACKKVVEWYENSGPSDPAPGSAEIWSVCRRAVKNAERS